MHYIVKPMLSDLILGSAILVKPESPLTHLTLCELVPPPSLTPAIISQPLYSLTSPPGRTLVLANEPPVVRRYPLIICFIGPQWRLFEAGIAA